MSQKKQARSRRRKHVPQRTCVVCRQTVDKRRLTRIVRTPDGDVVADPTGKRNGRGAYLCDRPACWERALHPGNQVLSGALRVEMTDSQRARLAALKPAATSTAAA